ncbi:MAG: penicillin-binding protein 2 [Actinomycetaceae bacterium]|nr:penicillin-binding protein 2 [Actinomycetaceae bacterium]
MSKFRAGSQTATRVFFGIAIFFFAAIALQLVNLQIIQGAELEEQGRLVRMQASTIQPRRGEIVDANGTPLATTIETYHIAVNQVNIANAKVSVENEDGEREEIGTGPVYVAEALAPLLDMDEAELGGQLIGNSTYHYLKKDVDTQTWRKIRALRIYGIEWEPSYKRVYPNEAVAAPVIGTIDAEGKGSSGLELTQDELLTGEPGRHVQEYGPYGEVIPGGKTISEPATQGATIHTTLRLDLQHAAEEIINDAVKTYEAEWGTVLVQEISTGKILVMAESGNKPISKTPQASRIVQAPVEPGSVGKILTFATALEEGKITPETPVLTQFKYRTHDGQEFQDSHEHEDYMLTATGVLAESSNTATVRVGEMVTDQQRYETMKAMHLGELIDIGMPGESSGILAKPEDWDGRQKYTTMFGQGYSVTQLQQVGILATIANGGVYQPARLIDGWTRPDGTYETAAPREPERALDPNTAKTVLTMLESTTADEEGTGYSFNVEGYRVAAKTGTAEIFDQGVTIGTATTVAGVVPADKPRIAVSVLLYLPKYGILAAQSAGPTFKSVVTESVRSLNIPASTEEATLYPVRPE